MELTIASFLNIFIAIGCNLIEKLDGLGQGAHPMFDITSDNTCCALRAQGNASVALVLEGVHLLLDNIGGIAYPALKELSMFKDRNTDFLVAKFLAKL